MADGGQGPGGLKVNKYGDRPLLAWIDKRALVIDDRYQRSIETKASQRLIAYLKVHFSWLKCLPLLLTDNGDGTYCVLDGQHRLAAVIDNPDIQDLPAYVVGELTLQEQALAFVDMNTHRVAVSPLAVHHARSKAGDPIAREMDQVANAAKCRIRRSAVPLAAMKVGDLLCLSTLRKGINELGPKKMTQVLHCVRFAWENGGIRGEILQGAVDFHAKGGSLLDLLARFKNTSPDHILSRAGGLRANDEGLHNLRFFILQVVSELRPAP